MWKTYNVTMHFISPFAASTSKNPKDIEAMIVNRAPARPPENAVPLEDLTARMIEEAQASEEAERGYATFLSDDNGLYYEARCVRGHIKDCANVLQTQLGVKALKSKVANRVYVQPARLYLNKQAPDGNETRIIHALTPKGPRSSFKTIDYVDEAVLNFQLKVLDDGVVTEEILQAIFDYGSVHGMGQERSQDWGKYDYILFYPTQVV